LNIRPISDLRNYPNVIREVAVGMPVFLTKNGRGRYVILDIQDYKKVWDKTFTVKKRSDGEESII